ncbi:MAG TPA: sterol desaturase family protein [Pyrinomonadaceae bacterium]|nr:sterol desaturase family protein [Pyrinomonadaceae bacterium]
MNEPLFGIPNLDGYIVIGIVVFFSLVETIAGYLTASKKKFGDWIQEAGGFVALSFVYKPLIVFLAFYLGSLLIPNVQNYVANSYLWAVFLIYLFIDDILQYWYHRFGHEYGWLWKLHRPHHQAEEMGFFVSYRNAGLYYLLMPNIWWVGLVVFAGGAKAVAIGLIVKQLVIIGSHSLVRWDEILYKYTFLNPLATVLERIIVTPAFHYAHHGKSMIDGVSDPNGNYGNMFSIWDQMFGTAKFTRQFPTEIGLVNDPKDKWTASYFYPLIASEKPDSEISRGFKKNVTTKSEPAVCEFAAGEKYLWCRCGRSQNQPFCDGSHHGTKFKPLLCTSKRDGSTKLCQCKLTKSPPFCDNSHSAAS